MSKIKRLRIIKCIKRVLYHDGLRRGNYVGPSHVFWAKDYLGCHNNILRITNTTIIMISVRLEFKYPKIY